MSAASIEEQLNTNNPDLDGTINANNNHDGTPDVPDDVADPDVPSILSHHEPSPVRGPSRSRSPPTDWEFASDQQALMRLLKAIGDTMSNSISEAISSSRMRDSATPAPESREQEPKANPPTEFDGLARRKLETFIAECEIMFATSPRRYRTESSKVHSAGSFLKGDPKKWFSNFFLLPPESRPLWLLSWEDFRIELRRTWGLEDPEGAAEEDLRRLRMTDKDRVAYFTSRFRTIQYRLPSWADRNLRNEYYSSLAPRIRTQFVTAGRAVPTTLEGLIRTAEDLDRAYWTDIELNKTLQDSSTSDKRKPTFSATSSPSSSKPSSTTHENKHLGPDGKLTPEERKRRFDNNLCLFCGQGKHLSANCPKKQKRGTQSSTLARASITVLPEEASISSEDQ